MKYILILVLTCIVTKLHSQKTKPLTDSFQKANNLDPEFIKQNIIGTWQDQNSKTTFKKKRYFIKYDNSKIEDYGTWTIKANQLILSSQLFPAIITCNIVFFSSDMFKLQVSKGDTTIWIHNRIK